jgi:hypothetical protein
MYMHSDALPHLSGEAPVPPGLDELPTEIMATLYAQAPGIVLVLIRPGPGAAEHLLGLKGDKRPARTGENTIRFTGEHLLFNFLHSPDDQVSAEQELSYLMGTDDAEALVQHATGPVELRPPLDAPGVLAALPIFGGHHALSFPFVLNKLRRRAVQRMAMLAGVSALDPRLSALTGQLDAEEKVLAQSITAGDRMRACVHLNSQTQRSLTEVHDTLNGRVDLTLAGISDLLVEGRPPSADAIRNAQSSGIYVSPLESLSIDAHRAALRADEN